MDASRLKQQKIMDLMVPRIKAFFLHLVSAKEFLELNVEDLTVFLQSNYAIIHWYCLILSYSLTYFIFYYILFSILKKKMNFLRFQ